MGHLPIPEGGWFFRRCGDVAQGAWQALGAGDGLCMIFVGLCLGFGIWLNRLTQSTEDVEDIRIGRSQNPHNRG